MPFSSHDCFRHCKFFLNRNQDKWQFLRWRGSRKHRTVAWEARMSAQEVAVKLLNAWKKDPPSLLRPNELHARYFLDDGCAYLGVAATDANKVHVIRLMEKLGLGSFKPEAG
jgi:hypothetical protein